jgi:hypothetical protein
LSLISCSKQNDFNVDDLLTDKLPRPDTDYRLKSVFLRQFFQIKCSKKGLNLLH